MPTNLDFSFDTNDIIEAEHVKQFVDPIQDLESGSAWYRAATGSSNAYVVDFSDEDENGLDAGALSPGQIIHFKANHTNTGAATLAVNGTGGMGSAIPLTKNGGTSLAAGDIQSGQMVAVLYSDESSGRFELIGGVGSGSLDGSGTANSLPKWSDSDTLTNSTAREPGSDNHGWGSGALASLSTGLGNVCLGKETGEANTSGSYNVAIGFRAAEANQAGNRLVAIGLNALKTYNQSADGSIGIGTNALSDYNVSDAALAIGYGAGSLYSGASGGVMLGKYAGGNATGQELVAIGTNAAQASTGVQLLALGQEACRYALGNRNIGLGHQAVRGNSNGTSSTGTNNVGIGASALLNLTSGHDNVVIGKEAGDAVTTGGGNTLVGAYTGSAFTTGANNVCLGTRAGDAATGSNKLFIHSSASSVGNSTLIYGEFDNRVVEFNAWQRLPDRASNPSISSGQAFTYRKGSKFVVAYNDSGTVRYNVMDMVTGSWTNSTTAP